MSIIKLIRETKLNDSSLFTISNKNVYVLNVFDSLENKYDYKYKYHYNTITGILNVLGDINTIYAKIIIKNKYEK